MSLATRLIDAVKVDNDVAAARRALKAGADPNTKAGMDRVMLYYAADKGNKDMVELLLSYKADPNPLDEEGFGPLHQAIAGGHFDIADLLIAAGANVNAQDKYAMLGLTPLHVAFNADLREERASRVVYMLENGADDTLTDTSGRSVMATGRERAGQFPYAGEIMTHMKEWQQNKADALARAAIAEKQAADNAIRDAVNAGITNDVVVPSLTIRRRGTPSP
ncbi:MAG: ankyrin repeat domain-containing protein [Alphaproteobacteria bacterium]|nr:ankyrin repeat domain-containing protein [Alphaproteobacteria bacterium]